MPQRDPRVRLLYMLDYARKAVAMVQGQRREDLDHDEKLRFALTHVIELIGEAASQVPPEVQKRYPEIPWPKVISMRHRLIHGYDFVDYDILNDTAALDQFLAERLVDHNPIPGQSPGRTGFKEWMVSAQTSFPVLHGSSDIMVMTMFEWLVGWNWNKGRATLGSAVIGAD
jgi:uncharacterized protein with HEPN domain